jgi:ssDNA-binding Zn-finger/Zn-ribbon topoisomerase 1
MTDHLAELKRLVNKARIESETSTMPCPECKTPMCCKVTDSGRDSVYSHFATCEERYTCPQCGHTETHYPY